MMSTIARRLRRAPFTLSLSTATLKTLAADVLTQRYLEDADAIDYKRSGVFMVFGFWYLGAFQYLLYVRAFPVWFPAAKRFGDHPTIQARMADILGLRDLAKQVAAGNFIHIPFLFLPSFYLTQEVTTHGGAASPRRALTACWSNWYSDCTNAWLIWIPGHAIFFSVPLWLRLPVNHSLSFLYTSVLSLTRGANGAS